MLSLLGSEIGVLELAWPELYLLSHLLRPSIMVFKELAVAGY